MKKIYVLGSINMDMVITTPYIPASGETLKGSNFFLNPGGKGANQAVACSKQNVETYLIANVGNDIFGNDIVETLNGYNVNTKYIKKLDGYSTGVANIIICNKDNRIILDSGANNEISYSQINEALKNANENDIFITQLENNLDAVIYGLKKAKEKRMQTIFNPSPAIKLDDEIYQFVDYLIINETECEILANVYPKNDDELKNAYKAFKNKKLKNLIVTLGSNGSVFINDQLFLKVAANKVIAVDTTAAGDTYLGVFASQLSLNKTIEEALKYASIASSLTCLKNGAQQAIPTFNEVQDYIKTL